jgi:hypothetical protein
MTSEQFAYWLQGFAELNGAAPDAAQWQSIKEHLQTVLNKVTSPVGTWPHLGTGVAIGGPLTTLTC